MTDLGKLLLVLGGVIVLVGAALMLAGRFNLPLGRLPGDITYRGKNTVFYFPIVTCIVISVVLSLTILAVWATSVARAFNRLLRRRGRRAFRLANACGASA